MSERPQDMLTVCDACRRYCTQDHYTCSVTNEDWCPACFPKTACGNRQHGAWCARRFKTANTKDTP